MNRLDGKIAFISGAARGIGAETARLMVEAGARVAIGDVLDERGRETAAAASGGERRSTFISTSPARTIGRPSPPRSPRFGGLDILVNNAGLFLGKGIEESSLDDWHRLCAVNLTGVFLGTKRRLPALRERGAASPQGSAIVNLASVAGLVGSQLDPLYSMTKGGVTLFTKSAALEFARKGYRIRVNSIHPGVIETDMGGQAFVAAPAISAPRCRGGARDGGADPSDRPARHAGGHRQRHRLPGLRRCRLHDRRRPRRRRRLTAQ